MSKLKRRRIKNRKMYNCIFCEEIFHGTLKLKNHLKKHNLNGIEIEKYIYDQVNLNSRIKQALESKKSRLKKLDHKQQGIYKRQKKEKNKKKEFLRIKTEIANFLRSKGYNKHALKIVREAGSHFNLSLILQKKCKKKHADFIHEKYMLNVATSKKIKYSINKKNQGLFDKTIYSIRTINTPMGNKG
jgi:hypothetical protein